jgi:hypothetical protein
MRYIASFVGFLILLGGCALQNPQLYEGPARAPHEQSVISSLGLYEERRLHLQVATIDGKPVDMARSASFHVLPGTYRIEVLAKTDFATEAGAQGYKSSWKEAKLEVTLTAVAGHTYVPNAVLRGDRIRVIFDDMGANYPQECLPLYRVVNKSSNPGHKLYSDGKACKI